MHIDGIKPGHGKNSIGQNKAISSHSQKIRLKGGQLGLSFCTFEAGGLQHGQTKLQGQLFNRRFRKLVPTASGSVGLSVHSHNFATRPSRQPFQAGGGKLWRSHEYYTALLRLSHFFTLLSYSVRRNLLILSINSMPSRWSYSCCMIMAGNSSRSSSIILPSRSMARR